MGVIKEFYCKSCMIWSFEGRLGTILMDDIKCTHICTKCYVASSSYTNDDGAGGGAYRSLEGYSNRIIAHNNG